MIRCGSTTPPGWPPLADTEPPVASDPPVDVMPPASAELLVPPVDGEPPVPIGSRESAGPSGGGKAASLELSEHVPACAHRSTASGFVVETQASKTTSKRAFSGQSTRVTSFPLKYRTTLWMAAQSDDPLSLAVLTRPLA